MVCQFMIIFIAKKSLVFNMGRWVGETDVLVNFRYYWLTKTNIMIENDINNSEFSLEFSFLIIRSVRKRVAESNT